MKYLLIFTLFIFSCYSPKKAENQLNKAKEKYPDLVAKKASNWFPCKEIKTISDSTDYKKWLASLDSLLTSKDTIFVLDTFTKVDSSNCEKCLKALSTTTSLLNKANNKISSIRGKSITLPAIHDTIIKLDSAQIIILSEQNKQINKEKEKYQDKYNLWLKLGISFLFAFFISFIFNILKFLK